METLSIILGHQDLMFGTRFAFMSQDSDGVSYYTLLITITNNRIQKTIQSIELHLLMFKKNYGWYCLR